MDSNNVMQSNDAEKGNKLCLCTGNKFINCLRKNMLTLLTILGVIGGVGLGFALRTMSDTKWSKRNVIYVNFVGEIFLRMLKSLILPLIISSLISAIANIDLSLSRKIATKAIVYYVVTTFLAITLGVVMVVTIKPGDSSFEHDNEESISRNITTVDTLLDLIK